uniref:HTH cro/C1-type domain-containing protein n=1 Tax=Curvibacter symbiont subsp. Hydra magnipapillata TaxID=667019 RepID=C9Y8V4_CURXX|nr:hypothetical protein Csp_A05550 [Curvibacter putative symbiont of Hydra magnipapillata]
MTHNNLAKSLRTIRKSKGISQEDFGLISSRTYVSSLERKLKSPTLSKVDELAAVLGVHPLTLLAGAYLQAFEATSVSELLGIVAREAKEINRVDLVKPTARKPEGVLIDK